MVSCCSFLVFQTLKKGQSIATISVQLSERNVSLASGTTMIFDIKIVGITLNG